jgi:hypothetical protein
MSGCRLPIICPCVISQRDTVANEIVLPESLVATRVDHDNGVNHNHPPSSIDQERLLKREREREREREKARQGKARQGVQLAEVSSKMAVYRYLFVASILQARFFLVAGWRCSPLLQQRVQDVSTCCNRRHKASTWRLEAIETNSRTQSAQKLSCTEQEWEELSSPWTERTRQLLAYKQAHGHTRVPKRYKENPGLGNWVNKQRQ